MPLNQYPYKIFIIFIVELIKTILGIVQMSLINFITKVKKWIGKNAKYNMKLEEANKKKKEVNALLAPISEVVFE